jgi:hypothetical protein
MARSLPEETAASIRPFASVRPFTPIDLRGLKTRILIPSKRALWFHSVAESRKSVKEGTSLETGTAARGQD